MQLKKIEFTKFVTKSYETLINEAVKKKLDKNVKRYIFRVAYTHKQFN